MVHNVAPGIEPVHGYGIAPLRQQTAVGDKSVLVLVTLGVKLRGLAMCCDGTKSWSEGLEGSSLDCFLLWK